MLEGLICQRCGAPLNPETLICEYCGTAHKRDELSPEKLTVVVTPVMRPVTTLRAKSYIPEDMARYSPEYASKMAVDDVVQKLARGLAEFIEFEARNDYWEGRPFVTGTLRVVEPVERLKGDFKFND